MKVIHSGCASLQVLDDGTLRYKYSDKEFTAEFSLFSEVGEPYKADFHHIFKVCGIHRGSVKQLDAEPWLADTWEEVA